jgi:hypothetical protein
VVAKRGRWRLLGREASGIEVPNYPITGIDLKIIGITKLPFFDTFLSIPTPAQEKEY